MLLRASLSIVLVALCLTGASATCKLASAPCTFVCEDGMELDLSPLATNDGKPLFSEIDSQGTWKYAYSPCSSFSLGVHCNNVAVCQFDPLNQSATIPVGTLKSLQVSGEEKKGLTLSYSATFSDGDKKTRQALVTLRCSADAKKPSLAVQGQTSQSDNNIVYQMTLSAKEACLFAPSTASTAPPANATTEPSNTTVPSANMTTEPASNMTTVPSGNVTTEITTAPQNATTTENTNATTVVTTEITTAANGTTPANSNATTVIVITTVPTNVTEVSTAPAGTTHENPATTPGGFAAVTKSAVWLVGSMLLLVRMGA